MNQIKLNMKNWQQNEKKKISFSDYQVQSVYLILDYGDLYSNLIHQFIFLIFRVKLNRIFLCSLNLCSCNIYYSIHSYITMIICVTWDESSFKRIFQFMAEGYTNIKKNDIFFIYKIWKNPTSMLVSIFL